MGTSTPLKSEQDELLKEMIEFDETKTGVKGLVDSGIAKLPRIFICPPDQSLPRPPNPPAKFPVIDFDGIESSARRSEIVDGISRALEKWGFFQMVNHGVPRTLLHSLQGSMREFQELPEHLRMEFYSRDRTRKVKYYTTGDMYQTKIAQWRDTLSLDFDDSRHLDLESLPESCRKAVGEYIECLNGLRNQLSEALGLKSDHLGSLECLEIRRLLCHFYPPCPEPELTMGIMKHSDPYVLTILLQDSFLVNAGDLLQLITNDRFKSVEHRVIAGRIGPRISAACFLFPSDDNQSKPFGPIKELLSDNNPAKYKETSFLDYMRHYGAKGFDGVKSLPHFLLTNPQN